MDMGERGKYESVRVDKLCHCSHCSDNRLVTNSKCIYSVSCRRNTIKVAAQEIYFQHHNLNVHKTVFSKSRNVLEFVLDADELKYSHRSGARRKADTK